MFILEKFRTPNEGYIVVQLEGGEEPTLRDVEQFVIDQEREYWPMETIYVKSYRGEF